MSSTPQLQQRIPFVDSGGLLSNEALRFLNDAFKALAKNTEEVATALSNALAASLAAAQAQSDATTAANDAADAANTAAAAALAAATAQSTAESAGGIAATAVQQNLGPSWSAPSGTASRASFATYTAPVISASPTQAEVQGVADAVQAVSRALKAAVDDLRANGALSS